MTVDEGRLPICNMVSLKAVVKNTAKCCQIRAILVLRPTAALEMARRRELRDAQESTILALAKGRS